MVSPVKARAIQPSSERQADGTFLFKSHVFASTAKLEEVVGESAPIVFVNGIVTPLPNQWQLLHALEEATKSPVLAVHNASFGLARDLLEAAGSFFGAENAAVRSLTPLVVEALRTRRPLRLVGASQGGLLIAAAVAGARQTLGDELSPQELQARLGSISVVTLGSPPPARGWPSGPTYRHVVNTKDPVASLWRGRSDVEWIEHQGFEGSRLPTHSPMAYFSVLKERRGWAP